MSRAIILNYRDGSVDFLPIPKDTPESREGEYVESHPCYDSDSMAYMIVGEEVDVFNVIGEEDGQAIYEFDGRI